MLFVSLGVGCSFKTNKTLDVCTHFMQKYTKGKYNEGYKKNLSTRKIMKMVASNAKKENLLKRHIIPSHTNEMYYVDSKYHKTSRENMNPGALCEREFVSQDHPQGYSKRNTGKNPYYCTLCGKELISMIQTKRHIKSVLCGNSIGKTSKVQKN